MTHDAGADDRSHGRSYGRPSYDGPFTSTKSPQPSGGQILALQGAVNHDLISELETLLSEAVSAGPLVLDLSSVTYLPSAALSVIIRTYKRPDGHSLALRADTGSIAQRILIMTGMPHTT